MWIAILVSLVVVAAAVLLTKRKEKGPAPRPDSAAKSAVADAPPAEPDYRAVAVKPGGSPCGAVLELADQPFLVNKAPLLPLKDCGKAACDCAYERLDDRRTEDRRHPFGSLSNNRIGSHYGEERRDNDRRIEEEA
ncbi:MAG: hypothetical protein ACR2QV_06335 [Gammaproteobacteria bacterium]